jgi:SAM-dependent methyltransferase
MNDPRAVDFYRIPSLYDILHTPGTAREVDGLERIALTYCRTRTSPHRAPTWLEPACGTGRYLRVAAGRGTNVVGLDTSEPMIDYARRRFKALGLPARLLVADMRSFTLRSRSVDFAFNLINTIRHLPSDAAMLDHLRLIARVLRPGGSYAVGLNTSAYGSEYPSEDIWEGRRGRCHVRQIVQFVPPVTDSDLRRRIERVHSHLIVTRPRSVEHIDSTYTLRCYSPRQWRRLIDRSPLRLAAIVNEDGDPIGDPPPAGYAIYVLTNHTVLI